MMIVPYLMATAVAVTGAVDRVLTEGTEGVYSPDGKTIAFQRDSEFSRQVCVMDLANGQVQVVAGDGQRPASYPAWGPNGELAYSYLTETNTALAADGLRSEEGLNLYIRQGGKTRRITRGRWFDMTPAFSPDGKHLYYASTVEAGQRNTSSLFRLDLSAGTNVPTTIARGNFGHTGGMMQPVPSPDGKRVVWSQLDGFTFPWRLCAARSDRIERFCGLTSPTETAYGARWSPDGHYIVYTGCESGEDGWGVCLQEVRTGARKRLFDGHDASFSPDGKSLVYDRNGRLIEHALVPSDYPVGCAADSSFPDERVVWRVDSPAHFSEHPMPSDFVIRPSDTVFVRAKITWDGDAKVYQRILDCEFGESPIGLRLYLAVGIPHVSVCDSTAQYFSHSYRDVLPVRDAVLTGIKTGDSLYIVVDGYEARSTTLSAGTIPLMKPRKFKVTPLKMVNKDTVIHSIEVGYGWPANVPKPFGREDLCK